MSFFERYLDPAESLGEILFGLIMVLTFTLGAAVAGGWERGLILAAVGCNVAWGIIDGALFLMSRLFERSRRGRLIRAIRQAPDAAAALTAIRREMEAGLESVTEPADREQLYRSVHALIAHGAPAPVRLRRDDWIGALAVFLLVTATALPAVPPSSSSRIPTSRCAPRTGSSSRSSSWSAAAGRVTRTRTRGVRGAPRWG